MTTSTKVRITGVAVTASNLAIVTLLRSRDDALAECIGVERREADLAWLADQLLERVTTAARLDRIVIDAGAGLGGALWLTMGEPKRDPTFVLEQSRGRDRQAIMDSLIAAVTARLLTFTTNDHEAAMKQSLGKFRREVGEDGVLGDELTTALAVALHAPVKSPPRVW